MKKLKIKYIYLGIIAIVNASCSAPTKKVQPIPEKYCENEIRLFSISDSLTSIIIDYNIEPDSIMKAIGDKLQKDLCWKVLDFGLDINNMKPIHVKLHKKCLDGTIRCSGSYPEVSILLNQQGLLMIENDIISIDSVKFWIYENFPNNYEYDLKEISIMWTMETPKDSIEKTFINVVDGYLMNYEELSIELFSKNICKLSEMQVDSLKNRLPFNIQLGMGLVLIPPPPPPPPPLPILIEE